MTKPKGNKVEIHYNRAGQILAIVDAVPQKGVSAGLFQMAEARSIVVELSPAQREMSLLMLHATHYVDVRGASPHCVP